MTPRTKKQTRALRIGLFGFGVVGTGVWDVLSAKRAEFRKQFGIEIEIPAICVKDIDKRRNPSVPASLLTTDADRLLEDDSIDVMLELIGGRYEAANLIERALESRKHVITANKLVLAHELPRFSALAKRNGVELLYSASVCGSVPVLAALDELRSHDTIREIKGIVNGSTNFILTMMSELGVPLETAMAEARIRGFLEADPTLDVSGADAAQKLSVLTYHAFGEHVPLHDIQVSGIEEITAEDFQIAKQAGETIKLIASAHRNENGKIEASVGTRRVPLNHLFAHTRDEFNALEISALHAGPQVLYGKGAGSLPTASAVVSDLVALVKGE
ncbi:MAG TPA: homoserine dehydrogenase [Candidatus Kapabacteria bacterium]